MEYYFNRVFVHGRRYEFVGGDMFFLDNLKEDTYSLITQGYCFKD